MRKFILDPVPLALYNADKKELIGVFKSSLWADRYLFDETYKGKITNTAFIRKCNIKAISTKLNCKIAVRRATPEQVEKIAEIPIFIASEGYPLPDKNKYK